jgi:hypothetical protein
MTILLVSNSMRFTPSSWAQAMEKRENSSEEFSHYGGNDDGEKSI